MPDKVVAYMNIKEARKLASFLKNSPLHPQWTIFRLEKQAYRYLAESVISTDSAILDIGCGHRVIEQKIGPTCSYIGLDLFETATKWYGSKPDVYADAQQLPVKGSSIDHVLALEVMEHIRSPEKVVQEAYRVLKKNGTLIISVPFMYPLHDEPYDFRRWTRHGLKELIEGSGGLKIDEIRENGGSIASAAIIFNLTIIESFIQLIKISRVFWILSPMLMLIFTITNLFSLLDILSTTRKSIAPLGYLLVARKV